MVSRLIRGLALVLFAGSAGQGAVITQVIDGTGDGAGNMLDLPRAVAVDSGGNVFVAGWGSDNVFKITPVGVVSQILDATGDGAGNTLDEPRAVEVDGAGNVFVAGSDNVFKVTPAGVVTEIIDATGDGGAHALSEVLALALDGAGAVFVLARETGDVFRISPAGVVTVAFDAGQEGLAGFPQDIGIDDTTGDLLWSAGGESRVLRIEPGGATTTIFDKKGDGTGRALYSVSSVGVDGSGNVYVVNGGSNDPAIYRVGPTGDIRRILGQLGDGEGNTVGTGGSLAVDAAGNAFMTTQKDTWGVFWVTPDGVIRLIIDQTGDGGGNPLAGPRAVATDGVGRVWVAGDGSDNVFEIESLCGDGVVDLGEACDDGNLLDGDCCSSSCDASVVCPGCEECNPATGLCEETPRSGCRVPTAPLKAKLIVRDGATSDKMIWKWVRGEATAAYHFGDPSLGADDYSVCVYDAGANLVMRADVPGGGTCGGAACWRFLGQRGFKYQDREGTADGVFKVLLGAGDEGKAKALVKAKGAGTPIPALPLALPATVQLQSSNRCWEAEYLPIGVLKNDATQFVGRAGSP